LALANGLKYVRIEGFSQNIFIILAKANLKFNICPPAKAGGY
jgi:hypothetical protein